jgi:hypothetical protein
MTPTPTSIPSRPTSATTRPTPRVRRRRERPLGSTRRLPPTLPPPSPPPGADRRRPAAPSTPRRTSVPARGASRLHSRNAPQFEQKSAPARFLVPQRLHMISAAGVRVTPGRLLGRPPDGTSNETSGPSVDSSSGWLTSTTPRRKRYDPGDVPGGTRTSTRNVTSVSGKNDRSVSPSIESHADRVGGRATIVARTRPTTGVVPRTRRKTVPVASGPRETVVVSAETMKRSGTSVIPYRRWQPFESLRTVRREGERSRRYGSLSTASTLTRATAASASRPPLAAPSRRQRADRRGSARRSSPTPGCAARAGPGSRAPALR